MPVDKHYSTAIGGVVVLATLEPILEMSLGVNFLGSLGPEVMGPTLTVILFAFGLITMTEGGTRAAQWLEDVLEG